MDLLVTTLDFRKFAKICLGKHSNKITGPKVYMEHGCDRWCMGCIEHIGCMGQMDCMIHFSCMRQMDCNNGDI